MSVSCPNGHLSQTTDYCDQCGAPLASRSTPTAQAAAPPAEGDPSAVASSAGEVEISPDTKPSVPAEPCPDCATPRVGSDRFCEGCGYNFATGESATPRSAAGSTHSPAGVWEVVVEADREYFERVDAEGVGFPSHYQPRRFTLEQVQIAVGRHSQTRGTQPQIDLSGAPEDPAISHLQAILVREDDGSYAIVDPGSSNGTTLNDDPDPIAPNIPVPLANGDRIHIGAWTTIAIRRREV